MKHNIFFLRNLFTCINACDYTNSLRNIGTKSLNLNVCISFLNYYSNNKNLNCKMSK